MSQVLLQLYGNSSCCSCSHHLALSPSFLSITLQLDLPCIVPTVPSKKILKLLLPKCSLSLIFSGGKKNLLFPEVSSLHPQSPQLIWQVLQCSCPQLEKAGNNEGTGTLQGLDTNRSLAQQEGQGRYRKLRSQTPNPGETKHSGPCCGAVPEYAILSLYQEQLDL